MKKLLHTFLFGLLATAAIAQSDHLLFDSTVQVSDTVASNPELNKLEVISINEVQVAPPQDDTLYISADSLSKLEPEMAEINLGGKVYSAYITEDGDTLIMANFDDVSITSKRSFDSEEEYRKYMKFRRYANKVYPYAKEAIRIFKEVEYATDHYPKRKRKKRIKELQEELKQEFEEPLKKLTKLQGKIMIKMIERELDETMYNLIKSLRGRFTAFYWHNFSKLYSYDLKEGYQYGKYQILDIVLQDFDVSLDSPLTSRTLKYVKVKG